MEKYSLSDIAALMGNKESNFLEGNGILIILFFLIAFSGGWGGFGGFGNAGAQGALTRAELAQGFADNNIQRKVDGVAQGLCDGFYAQNTAILNGVSTIQGALCTGFGAVNSNINQLGYQVQNCCCETNRNIDAVRYEAAQNTCAITTNATANTQRILDKLCQMESDAKDQKIADLSANLQSAQLQLGNLSQTQTILNHLGSYTPYGAGCGCYYS